MKDKTCFVLMPFKATLKDVHEHVYKHVCEENGLKCWRVDEIYTPGLITKEIVSGILHADIVVADLTDQNPNVFYELGIAHATSNKTILTTQSIEKLPFDISQYGVIRYENTFSGFNELRISLDKAIKTLLVKQNIDDHPVRDVVSKYLPLKKPLEEGGLTSFRPSFHGFPHRELLATSEHLLIVMNDGRSWIDGYREQLEQRAKTNKRTLIVLIHPRSEFVPTLIRKNGKKKSTQIDELRRSFEIISGIKANYPGNVEIRGHYLFNPYSIFVNENQAVIMPYFFNEAGELPVLTFSNTGNDSLYERYKNDAYRLFGDSKPLRPSDFSIIEV
jgi:hypothetical protein